VIKASLLISSIPVLLPSLIYYLHYSANSRSASRLCRTFLNNLTNESFIMRQILTPHPINIRVNRPSFRSISRNEISPLVQARFALSPKNRVKRINRARSLLHRRFDIRDDADDAESRRVVKASSKRVTYSLRR